MDFLHMDQTEIVKWAIMLIVGGAGWAFALGRKVITAKVIEEASQIFVKRDIYDLEVRNMQNSITSNHADLVIRLDKAVDQINKKIDLLTQ